MEWFLTPANIEFISIVSCKTNDASNHPGIKAVIKGAFLGPHGIWTPLWWIMVGVQVLHVLCYNIDTLEASWIEWDSILARKYRLRSTD
jgi:hypothetical protein